jgi:tetratricopeptide (TPR) repeat protein
MTDKKLAKNTIIPSELYVERSADRQLNSIVDSMGRPGYVLVARQMGKTNLLINMKRKRKDDLVLYIDLSIRFDSARALFRHIIDSLLEAFFDEFSSIIDTISSQRQNTTIDSHIEFDRHLRSILRATRRRIIIILDEIDSLVSTSYSDSILAQIRSMYFSRITHPEYERLTYILSGVAEPTDLIKNKNISPFNIGEKIYLDDFSRLELNTLVNKAKLKLTDEIIDFIFSWTSGNPRMCWDICSEIEDRILSGEEVTQESVFEIINFLYLNDFDRPPIDHIRSLIHSDKKIRDAIISIRYSKFDFLDDKTKNKLYLSGITSGGKNGIVRIKNKIIDEAISDRWLEQIGDDSSDLFKIASENYSASRYNEAIKYYEKIIENGIGLEKFSGILRLQYAESLLKTGDQEKSRKVYDFAITQTNDANTIQLIQLDAGISFCAFGYQNIGLDYLKKASRGDSRQHSTKANSSILKFLASNQKTSSVTISECEQYLNAIIADPAHLEPNCSNNIKTEAQYFFALILFGMGKKDQSKLILEEALSKSSSSTKPAILGTIYELLEKNPTHIENAIREVIDNKLSFCESIDGIEFSELVLAKLLSISYTIGHHISDEILDYSSQFLYDKLYTKSETLVHLHRMGLNGDPDGNFDNLLLWALKLNSAQELSIERKLYAYRKLTKIQKSKQQDSHWKEYLRIASNNVQLCEIDDVNFLHDVCVILASSSNRHLALKLAELTNSIIQNIGVDKIIESWFISNILAMNLHAQLKNKHEASKLAFELNERIDTIELGDEYSYLKRMIDDCIIQKPVKNEPNMKIPRNEKVTVQYLSGEIVVAKFKSVIEDVKSKKCKIIS